jgi:hypothetical protein
MIEPMLWFFALIGMLFCLYHAGKVARSLSCRLQAWASQIRVISIRRLRSSPSLIAFARAAELDYVRSYDRLEELLAEAGVQGAWYEFEAVTRRNWGPSETRERYVIISERRLALDELLNDLKALGGKPERVPAIDYRKAEVTSGQLESLATMTRLFEAG